jgi:small subunit ribosomal protein S21
LAISLKIRGYKMPGVSLKHPNESFESLMRRFKKAVEKSDILKTLREYEAYEKPSERKKRLKAAAVKRWARVRWELSLPEHRRKQLEEEGESKR